jgi:SAM-dependent methyltransferase
MRALDIGAWDGPLTFELERRGADVTALDIQDPNVTVFDAVKAIKKYKAQYFRASIYDALPTFHGLFDIVLFVGVYYHLRNPSLALENIRKLIKPAGTLYIEGASGTDHLAKTLSLDSALIDRQPIAYLDVDKKLYGFSSFWYPTTRGLEAVLLDTGFHNPRLTTGPNTLYSHARITGSATADPNKTGPRVHSVYKHDFQTDDPMRAKVRRFIIRTINEVIGK